MKNRVQFFPFFLFLLLIGTPIGATKSKRVLIFGLDGCRPDALAKANTPHIDELILNGAFSDKAQTGEITYSGPGWSSMLTGVWRNKHGVHNNTFVGNRYDQYPHFFKRLKEIRPNAYTASIVSWTPIATKLVDRKSTDYSVSYSSRDDLVADFAIKQLTTKDPIAIFVYFGDVDYAGHDYGFSPQISKYIETIETTDRYVGEVMNALRDRPNYDQEDWLILCSTDHGGTGKSHGRNIPLHRTIFFIASGESALRGTIVPPPKIVDVAVTALVHIGVEIKPKWFLDGEAVGIKIGHTAISPKSKLTTLWAEIRDR